MSMHKIADHLAAMGRGNDKMLMHVTPNEVAGLQRLAMAHGGSLTVNPHTGLPEAGFFDFVGSLLPTAAGILAAPATGGSSLYPVLAGAATGAAVSALKGDNPLFGALTGGLGGYGGSGFKEALGASAGATGAAPLATNAGATLSNVQNALQPMTQQAAQGAAPFAGLPGIPAGPSPATLAQSFDAARGVASGVDDIAATAQQFGGSTGAKTIAEQAAPVGLGERLSNIGQGLQNLGTEAGRNAFVQSLGGTGPDAELKTLAKVGLPVLGAGLASIEPPKIGGGDVYDPYATLNINRPTKLRLYAQGGVTSAYEVPDNVNSTPMQDSQSGYAFNSFKPQQSSANPGATVNVINQIPGQATTQQGGYPTFPQYQQPQSYADGGNVAGGDEYALNLLTGERQLMGEPDMPRGFSIMGLLGRQNPLYNAGLLNLRPINAAKGGYLDGPGDGMSDSIPATIEGKQPARLADGEFVIPADVVSHLGNGSTKAGAQKLYQMMDKVRTARTGTKKQGKQINPHKYMPA